MENMEIPERRSATIYIDGDAIPRELKEAVYRAAERTRIPAVLVANSFQRIPASALVRLEVTGSGFDAADNRGRRRSIRTASFLRPRISRPGWRCAM